MATFLLGVNLAGAEFGKNVPGVFGTDYTYPTHTEIDYYASKGMDVIRLPFLWERLQRTELGPLDATELGRLDDVVNYATGKGLKIEIEPHNYGYGFGALIGSAQTPNSSFADLWGKLAVHYKSNPDVIFGLMNEPHDQIGDRVARPLPTRRLRRSAAPGRRSKSWCRAAIGTVHGPGPPRTMPLSSGPAFKIPPTISRSRSTSISTRWQRHASGRRLSNYWHRASDRSHAMGGGNRKSFVPGRSRRQHRSNKFDCVGRNADLHPAAYQRLGRSDLLGGWPVVGDVYVLD